MKLFEWLEGRMDKLGDRIGSPFDKLTDWADQTLQTRITGSFEDLLEHYEQELKIPLKPFFEEVLKNPELPPEIRKLIEEAKDPQQFAMSTALAAAAGIAIIPALSASMSGGISRVQQGSMQKFSPSLLSVDEVIGAYWRGNITSEILYEELDKHGYDDDKKLLIAEVRRYIPNPQDLIQFTVRDVFREDVVKKYGYDQDFDKILEDLGPWLRSVGMDKDVMRMYWRAHWALPSVTQAFEMLHRGEINLDDIRELLRISDVAPSWIDPLIQIAYAPYTRVDVRRMYDAGVIDKEAVMRAYLDLGYDEEHAENLTAWSVAESMSTEKDLSKAEILTAYVQGAISVGDTESALVDMGYDADEAKLILAIQDYKTESKILGREKKIMINKFARGDLIVEDLKKELQGLGLPEREINITVEEAHTKIKEKIATPTKADLLKWLDKGIISKDVFMSDMRLKGYSQAHIDNYIKAAG